jgi:Rod binding domain-containing protein
LADATLKPDKVAKAAKDFEALMVGEVMKAARASSDGSWLGTGDDQAGALAMDMAEQQFAQALASGGGLGIAKMVTSSLARGQAKTASTDPGLNPSTPSHTD